jgi:hypothetical protein
MLLAASALFAKVASIRFEELVESSDLIVVAEVDSVNRSLLKRYAQARVTEVWKGAETASVEFLASPTWTCDISAAIEGERVVLFLTQGKRPGSYTIAYSGRGRMPLRTVDGVVYATFWPDVILPEGTPTIDGPEPEWSFIRSIEVAALRSLVRGGD